MNDTTRRFLHAIMARLPAGEIVELQLFPAIRSGATESGAAVIALEPAVVAPDPSPDESASVKRLGDEPVDEGEEPAVVQGMLALEADVPHNTDMASVADVAPGDDSADDALSPAVESTSASARVTHAAVAAMGAVETTGADDDVADGERAAHLPVTIDDAHHQPAPEARLDTGDERDDDSPYRDDPPTDAEVSIRHVAGAADLADDAEPNEGDETMALGDLLSLPSPDGELSEPPGDEERSAGARDESPAIKRYAILSARYRLTLKGPDRGKWELELKHEADAPLDTVQRVARGVARRAGDESDPEHFSGESLRLALEAPAWATTP